MSQAPATAASKAVYAPSEYFKYGEGASKHFGFAKHVAIAMTVGLGLSFAWKVCGQRCGISWWCCIRARWGLGGPSGCERRRSSWSRNRGISEPAGARRPVPGVDCYMD